MCSTHYRIYTLHRMRNTVLSFNVYKYFEITLCPVGVRAAGCTPYVHQDAYNSVAGWLRRHTF